MLKDNKGLTLVEVMIALVILLLVFLALMQTALVSINSNMVTVLRNEAVSIAEEYMNEAKNIGFDSLASAAPVPVQRDLRNIPGFQYTVTRTVSAAGTDTSRVDITVTWNWKGSPYTHSISTIVRRQ